ncbi:MAG: GNAT N-acetyltransferase [Oscillospiraceae bacterium]|jgi:RimJ/RimL family protein N-acetyltransferase|nr:GNAT N-acetyltransferase [Oscillospiraceae bacterium]
MGFRFADYDPQVHLSVDAWRGEDITRFAMDGSLREEWQYYRTCGEYSPGKNVFCKVALLAGAPVAAMIVFGDPVHPVGINPIIVDPARCGQGIGSAVLRVFVDHIDEILPQRSNRIEVGIDEANAASRRAFENAGFVLDRIHPDGHFLYYSYYI